MLTIPVFDDENAIINLTSFVKDESSFEEYPDGIYFTDLVFCTSSKPLRPWSTKFQNLLKDKFSKIFEDIYYCDTYSTIIIRDVKVHINKLQSFIDDLKSLAAEANKLVAEEKNQKLEKERHFNDTLDNLKF